MPENNIIEEVFETKDMMCPYFKKKCGKIKDCVKTSYLYFDALDASGKVIGKKRYKRCIDMTIIDQQNRIIEGLQKLAR